MREGAGAAGDPVRRRPGAGRRPGQRPTRSWSAPAGSGRTSPRCCRSRRPRAAEAAHRQPVQESMQLQTVSLDDALRLLSLPRLVGVDPASGEEITAQNGRYGPYLKKGTDSRSLESEDQIFEIGLEQALAIYAQPKQRGRRPRGAAARAGPGPGHRQADRGQGRPVRRRTSPTARRTRPCARATASRRSPLERAAELLADKRAGRPAEPAGAKKVTAKKTAAKSRGEEPPRRRPPRRRPPRRRPPRRRPPRRRRPRRRPPRLRRLSGRYQFETAGPVSALSSAALPWDRRSRRSEPACGAQDPAAGRSR